MKVRHASDGQALFWCPGCDEPHALRIAPASGAIWGFNGDDSAPTFSPSVLMRSGHHVPGQEGKECWCTYEQRTGKPAPFKCAVCHSFVREGRIQFLTDSTHALAGQTVDVPDWPAEDA